MVTQRREIIVTRQLSKLKSFARCFPEDGFRVTECPTFSIHSLVHGYALYRALQNAESVDCFVFGSQAAVTSTFGQLDELDLGLDLFRRKPVYALGKFANQCLRQFDVESRLVDDDELVDGSPGLPAFLDTVPSKIMWFRADNVRRELMGRAVQLGHEMIAPVVYRGLKRENIPPPALKLLDEGRVQCVAFVTPSSVKALEKILGAEHFVHQLSGVDIASQDKQTSAALAEAGLQVAIEAPTPRIEDLGHAIVHFYR